MSIASSNTTKNSTKLRIVFLGDQGVGKSSIIDRYTTNNFEEAHNVLRIGSSRQLVLILMSEISLGTDMFTGCRCGTLLAKRGTAV